MAESKDFTDALAKWSVPILLAVLGFIGTGISSKVEALSDKVGMIQSQAAATQATLLAAQGTLNDFKADAASSRQDTKEKLNQAAVETNAKFDQLTAWIQRLSNQIHGQHDPQ